MYIVKAEFGGGIGYYSQVDVVDPKLENAYKFSSIEAARDAIDLLQEDLSYLCISNYELTIIEVE